MLYLIGLGLGNEKDITLQGLEIIHSCDMVYLENYTSKLQCSVEDLERLYRKKIIQANRETAEQGADKIITEAQKNNVAFLVIGDPFSATTHVELFRLAYEKKVPVKVVNNASVLTAMGIVGLELYKFGRTISIPFFEDHPQLESPYNLLRANRLLDMHTLVLLDLKTEQQKFMAIPEALEILETIEKRKQENVIKDSMIAIGCARLGSDDYLIRAARWKDLKKVDFGKPPHCLIIPGKLHFLEEEMLELWK